MATHIHVNFLIFYEIDQQTVKTVLRRDDYDSDWLFGQASYDA